MIETGLYWLPAGVMAVVIFWLSHQRELPGVADMVPDWWAHGVEYGLFTLTLVFGASRGFTPSMRRRARLAAAVLMATLYGITDEYHQSFVGRDATVHDWLADTVGALLMALLIGALWRRMASPEERL